jgi:hypothetical protein
VARQLESLDVSDLPELARAAAEVRSTNRPRVLKRGDEELAILMPIRRRPVGRGHALPDYEAFRAAAGSWKDHLDVEQFIEDNYRQRQVSTRPLVSL